ncbi:MAG: 3-oxoadipate enol-lactonase [Actinomycetota bacterium]|nr:3-oxoadipate enol-lactonase [Actinomycetota bacterium]
MESLNLDVNGVSFKVRIDGSESAPWLMMLNSLSTTYEMWDEQIPNLSGYFRVIRYDQRGHGGTSSPTGPYSIEDLGRDALGLLDALGAEKVSLVGLSLGGMISMWLAANAPQRIEKMVIACTSANFAPPEFWTDRAVHVRDNGTMQLYGSLLERWFTNQIDVRNPRARELVKSMLNSCNPEGYASICEALGLADLRAQLGSITCPTLVIAGALDPVSPPSTALSLFEAIQGASLSVIPDSSHLANLEQPDLFIDAALEHLIGSAKTRGIEVRTEVLGSQHVAEANSRTTEFTAPFQDFISRYAWGEIWARPGLDRRSRSLVTLSILVSLGRLGELSFHLPAALRNGLTREEIMEVLIQCGVYAGVPAANSAFAQANEILKSLE